MADVVLTFCAAVNASHRTTRLPQRRPGVPDSRRKRYEQVYERGTTRYAIFTCARKNWGQLNLTWLQKTNEKKLKANTDMLQKTVRCPWRRSQSCTRGRSISWIAAPRITRLPLLRRIAEVLRSVKKRDASLSVNLIDFSPGKTSRPTGGQVAHKWGDKSTQKHSSIVRLPEIKPHYEIRSATLIFTARRVVHACAFLLHRVSDFLALCSRASAFLTRDDHGNRISNGNGNKTQEWKW